MFVVCSILLTISVGGVGIMNKTDVEGRLLKEDSSKYLVDFSDNAKVKGALNPDDYKKMLVEKNDCIKE